MTHRDRSAPRACLFLLIAGTLAPSACQQINNDRMSVGGETLPTFMPPEHRAEHRVAPAVGPSITGIDRDAWPVQTILVADDGTQHHPRWTSDQPAYVKGERAQGAFPDERTALELGSPGAPQVYEAAAAPFHAALDVVLLPVRVFAHPPGAVRSSPVTAYERGPAIDRALYPDAPAVQPAGATTGAP